MKSSTKTILGVLMLVLLIGGAYLGYNMLSEQFKPENPLTSSTNESGEEEKKKVEAPDFTMTDGNGSEVQFSDFKGKPIVLNFWASWCSPCKKEMPHFDTMYRKHGEDIVFLMVDLVDGKQETVKSGQKYISEQGFTFPVYFDTKQDAAMTYGIPSIPTTVFIDREGNIVTGYRGMLDEEMLASAIAMIQ